LASVSLWSACGAVGCISGGMTGEARLMRNAPPRSRSTEPSTSIRLTSLRAVERETFNALERSDTVITSFFCSKERMSLRRK